MDTTASSLAPDDNLSSAYISCIKIDGHVILPPIMTEEKRSEMRRYRQQALEREQRRQISQLKNKNILSRVAGSQSGGSSTFSSPPKDPDGDRYLTSTPKSQTMRSDAGPEAELGKFSSRYIFNKGRIMTGTENVPVSSSTSTPSLAKDMDEEDEAFEKNDNEAQEKSEDEESTSGDNFASAASSTGTFIIKRDSTTSAFHQDLSEGEVESLDEDNNSFPTTESEGAEPKTVIRNPTTKEPYFKRKRPARYFDNDHEDIKSRGCANQNQSSSDDDPNSNTNTQPTYTTTASTSLSKYLQSPVTPSFTPLLPNAIPPSSNEDVNFKASPTFTINTDFLNIANANAAKSKSESPQRSIRVGHRRISSGHGEKPNISNSKLSVKSTPEMKTQEEEESDKENNPDKPHHVRKLSYTLMNPSAALLAATNNDMTTSEKEKFVGTLSMISSVQSTPVKGIHENPLDTSCVRTTTASDESDRTETALDKLQQLHLGKGKKAHLERYLGELRLSDETEMQNVPCSAFYSQKSAEKSKVATIKDKDVGNVLTRIEQEHQQQLESLMEVYKLQAQKMREQFEKEKSEILQELRNSTVNNNSRNYSQTQLRSPKSPILTDTSNLRNSNYTPTKNSTPNSKIYDSAANLLKSPGGQSITSYTSGADLGGVGLSKLQTKMQKINPAMFKNSVDVRSPLLKGLVFPDPLDRPSAVLKIPDEAYDPKNKPKFDRLTAAVKGYLIRRLLHTEKIQIIIQTIRDTVELLLNLYEENPPTKTGFMIKPQDDDLHKRLLQQLTGACSSFHDIFFKISIKERMAIVANDREKIRAKALRNVLSRRQPNSPAKKTISNATLKSIERRLTQSRSPGKRNERFSIRNPIIPSSHSQFNNQLSQSVKAKPVKSYNVVLSPKRRRMSHWGGGSEKSKSAHNVVSTKSNAAGMTRATTAISGGSANSNPVNLNIKGKNLNLNRPYTTTDLTFASNSTNSARSTISSSSTLKGSGNSNRMSTATTTWSTETFLVPSATGSRQNSWGSNASSSSAKSASGRNPRASVTNSRTSTANSNSNRGPWKK